MFYKCHMMMDTLLTFPVTFSDKKHPLKLSLFRPIFTYEATTNKPYRVGIYNILRVLFYIICNVL